MTTVYTGVTYVSIDAYCSTCGNIQLKSVPVEVTDDGNFVLTAECPTPDCDETIIEVKSAADLEPDNFRFYCTNCNKTVKVDEFSAELADDQIARHLGIPSECMLASGRCKICGDGMWSQIPQHVDAD